MAGKLQHGECGAESSRDGIARQVL